MGEEGQEALEIAEQELDGESLMPDVTENMCEYCVTLHVKRVPPKRPLSPFIFFS